MRAVFGVCLLTFVVLRLDPARVLGAFREVDPFYLGLAVVLQIVAKVVWALRWQDILRALGLVRRLTDLLALVLIGLFFNYFLPTSSGGDLVRGYFSSQGRDSLTLSYSAVVVERVLGLITLAATAAVAALVALRTTVEIPPRLLWFALLASALTTVLGTAVFMNRGWQRALARRFGGKIAEASRAMGLFHEPGTRRLRIVASSFALQLIGILFYSSCAYAIGVDVALVVMFLVVPVSVVASMMPVTLNGLGVREGVFVALLAGVGVASDRAAAFALLALAVATAFALIGGILYPFYGSAAKGTKPSGNEGHAA